MYSTVTHGMYGLHALALSRRGIAALVGWKYWSVFGFFFFHLLSNNSILSCFTMHLVIPTRCLEKQEKRWNTTLQRMHFGHTIICLARVETFAMHPSTSFIPITMYSDAH